MASLKKRKKGWLITVSKGRSGDGKQIMEYKTYISDPDLSEKQNYKLAKQQADEFEKEVKSPAYCKCSKKTYQAYVETEWLPDYCKGKMEVTTLELTADILNKFVIPVIGYKKLTDITSKDIEKVYQLMVEAGYERNGKHYPYSTSYIKRVHQVISSSLTKAYKWRYITENPCAFVDIPKPTDKKEIQFFTVEQCQKLFEAIQKPYVVKKGARRHKDGTPSTVFGVSEIPVQQRIFFFLAIIGGFRRSELLALTWDDIDFDSNEIHISKAMVKTKQGQLVKSPKTKSSIRTVTIPPVIMDMLKQYKITRTADTENLFIQSDGKPMAIDTPNRTLKKVIRIYNENHEDKLPNVSIHGLRHTSATILINNGINIKAVSSRLGHSETRTTLNIYTHPLKSADKDASDKMNSLLLDKC